MGCIVRVNCLLISCQSSLKQQNLRSCPFYVSSHLPEKMVGVGFSSLTSAVTGLVICNVIIGLRCICEWSKSGLRCKGSVLYKIYETANIIKFYSVVFLELVVHRVTVVNFKKGPAGSTIIVIVKNCQLSKQPYCRST